VTYVSQTIARLRAHRLEAGMSETDLDWACRFPWGSVQALEAGEADLTLNAFVAICQALHIDPRGVLPGPRLRVKGECR